MLYIVANSHEENDNHRSRPLSGERSRDHAYSHQGVSDHLASQRSLDNLAKDRVASRQHDRQTDVPRQALR